MVRRVLSYYGSGSARAVYTFTDHHDYNGRKPFFSMNIIKTLENAPRDANKLRRVFASKQRQKDEAMNIEDTQRLVTEEMKILNVVLYLVLSGIRRIRRTKYQVF
jgi:hypothetical protein